MKPHLVFSFIFSLLCSISGFAQQKVFVPYFEVINMNSSYQQAATRLFVSYMAENTKYAAVLPDRYDSNMVVQNFERIKEKATQLAVPYFVVGELNRIGETVIVVLSLYSTIDGVRVWNEKMKANTPEDLDPILQRIAKNIGTANRASADDNIYTVTEYDALALKKVQSTSYFGLSIGAAFSLGKVAATSSGLGLSWIYDTRKMLIEVNTQAFWGKHIDYYQAAIEGYYTFKEQKNTALLGGGLAFGVTSLANRHSYNYYDPYDPSYSYSSSNNEPSVRGGLTFIAGGGYMFNRTGNVSLRITGNAFVSTYGLDKYNHDAGILRTRENYLPLGFLLKLQVMFQR